MNVRVTEDPLFLKEIQELVASHTCGGYVYFEGNVREQTQGRKVIRLEFEAYIPMALKEMQKIVNHILVKWEIENVVIHHRVGHLEIGETAVVIGVSAPHRSSAFAACQYAIDTLKKTVPIWKKEIFEDGEVWVSAHP